MDELGGDILDIDEVRQPRMVFEVTVIKRSEERHQWVTLRKFLVKVAEAVRTRLIRMLWILVVQIVCPERELQRFQW